MTADEWKRIKAIASEAWVRPVAERTPYIARACAHSDQLHQEVASLVESMAAAEHDFEVPPPLPFDEAGEGLSLAGRRIGAYEVLSRIGAGGMGEVYRARDTRLDRIVAIKALAPRASTDPVSRERMLREARSVAALNHPHICTLYDIGSDNGLDFLVMEYVHGETLAARLSRGRLPVAEALQYAEQIASALLEAHAAGIVHRDVKPANIVLTHPDPQAADAHRAKLLDFGIAKAGPPAAPAAATGPRPVIAPDLTQAGLVLGSPHYMAPEQLERNRTDARTDIFAFGAVLYEMLTGHRAFAGADRAQDASETRTDDGRRLASLRTGMPAAVARIVTKCLAGHPDDRYQSAQDLIGDVRAAQASLSSSRARRLGRGLAVIVVLAGVAAWGISAGREPPSTEASTVVRLPVSAGVIGAPALSPSGSDIVFAWAPDPVSDPELVLLRIGSPVLRPLTNHEGMEEWPAWSPDGTRVAFIRCASGRCGIFVLSVDGGAEHKIRDVRNDRYYGLAWSPDSRVIIYAERASSSAPYALFAVSLDTLVPRALTTPPTGTGDLRFALSSDGRTLAVVRLENSIGVYLVSLDSGAERTLLAGQQEWIGGLTWSADGQHLIVSANQQGVRRLWRLPVVGGELEPLEVAGEDAYFPSVSSSAQRLAFVREFRDWDLSRMTLDRGPQRSAAPFPSSTRLDLDPSFSPDGESLAFVSERSGTRELWVSHADGTGPRQLTSLRGIASGRPAWSPDGQFLAFHGHGINVVPAAGGASRRVAGEGESPSWSADGRWIYFTRNNGGSYRVWKVAARGGDPVQVLTSEAVIAREGPDGAAVYFARVGGGIWRRPVAGGEEEPVIAAFDSGLPGYWTMFHDGIYYVARESLPDKTLVNHLRFFEFRRQRTVDLGTLPGHIDPWVGGLTLSDDRHTVIYSHRTYQSSEIVLIEQFR